MSDEKKALRMGSGDNCPTNEGDGAKDLPQNQYAVDLLRQAYIMVGDKDHANQCLLQLARIIIGQSDVDAARCIIDEVREYALSDPQAKPLMAELERLFTENRG